MTGKNQNGKQDDMGRGLGFAFMITFLAAFIITGTAFGQNSEIRKETVLPSSAEEILAGLTLEQKVAQMFFITPEALTGIDGVTAAGPATEAAFENYPVGGIVYFEQNILERGQVASMLENMQAISEKWIGLPIFLATDEEGGAVTRVYGSGIDKIPYIPDMLTIGASGDTDQAYRAGNQIGTYLKELNFNLDFAPVADIYSNADNTVIGSRAFGRDADTVSEMAAMAVRGLKDAGIRATLKHFPGHGETGQDSHAGYADSDKTLEELRDCELLPFMAGIEAGADFVMAGHISFPNILEDETPASLSYTMLTEILRGELGYSGIIITDALNMGAISHNYTSSQAAVRAVLAGADMLLMPADFEEAYYGVLNAVSSGEISRERIDDSLRRILFLKLAMKE